MDVCFIVRDAIGQAHAYVYFEDEPGGSLAGTPPHPRRGVAHRRERRQAAGTNAQALSEHPARLLDHLVSARQ
jgi:hypothetical protein